MATFKNKTLIEIAMFAVLEGMDIECDDAIVRTVKDLQCNMDTKQIRISFTDNSATSVGFSEILKIDVETLAITPSHTPPQASILPNMPKQNSKKRD